MLFRPLVLSVEQLPQAALLRVVTRSVIGALVVFVALFVGAETALAHYTSASGFWAWGIRILGGAASMMVALWLFLPISAVIAGFFMEPICRAVEARYYPGLAPPGGAQVAEQIWDGVAIGARIAVYSIGGLILALFLPGAGFFIALFINAYALGRGYFISVAMRRMTRREALMAYDAMRPLVLWQGAILALAGTLPGFNLLVPVLGCAMMVHVFHQNMLAQWQLKTRGQ